MDLTGKWLFHEEFSLGMDRGIADFVQHGDVITGVLEFEEKIEEETPFKVKCQLKGKVVKGVITLSVTFFEIMSSTEFIEYFPETREGIVNIHGQIVGSSVDDQGVCGFFVFDKVPG